jgi:serine/threonine protein phosphatase PrpC
MRLRYFAHSDVGLRREHNEDAYLADADLGLFVVCDGVGGRARGEVASSEGVQLIWEWIKRENALIDEVRVRPDAESVAKLCRVVRNAIQNATYMLNAMGEQNPDHKGMSTTATALLVVGTIAVVGQVGDSRVYLYRDGAVSQLTEDHTLINFQLKHGLITPEEAKTSRAKNVITRAVGHKEYVEVDTVPVPIFGKDRFLLCSDGLHGYLEAEADVLRIMSREVQEGVIEAIRYANSRGGSDNITAMIVEMLD